MERAKQGEIQEKVCQPEWHGGGGGKEKVVDGYNGSKARITIIRQKTGICAN